MEHLERQGRLVRGEFRPDGVEREWCHPEVLRVLRRRSLAALRREVEPVDHDVLARFIVSWQHVASRLGGLDGLSEVITSLQGAALPASMLEADILPARLAGYRATDLDTLLTAGEVVWVGAGSLGAGDGRIRLLWRDQVPLLAPEPADQLPDAPIHEALRLRLSASGASFWSDLQDGAHAAGSDYDDSAVLNALWDLVWAGEVTNDSLTPLRALVGGAGPTRRPAASGGRSGRRPGLRSLSRLGPPAGTGRWSLVEPLRRPAASPTEQSTARALQLLERYGVLTREMALAEGAAGGFAGVYPVLKELEDRGQVRRGYFVAGLGAAQFALPGAVDRLRSERDDGRVGSERSDDPAEGMVVLAAADPAQPYGAALPWPETPGRPSRSIGAYVVLRHGVPLAYLERGARSIVLFPGASDDPAWITALAGLVTRRQLKRIEVTKIDGKPPAERPEIRDLLLANGFKPGYKGPTLR
jgi:ATP-dependent Lhr-like helicase